MVYINESRSEETLLLILQSWGHLLKKVLSMVESGCADAVLLAFQDSCDAVLQNSETLSSRDCRLNAAPPGRQVTLSRTGAYVDFTVGSAVVPSSIVFDGMMVYGQGLLSVIGVLLMVET